MRRRAGGHCRGADGGAPGGKTLLVERYGRLGGMAVQAMVGPLMGNVRSAWVDEILEHIGGRRVDYEFIDLKYAELLQKAGCQILLHAWITEPLLDGKRVTGARLLTKQGMIEVERESPWTPRATATWRAARARSSTKAAAPGRTGQPTVCSSR